MIRIEVLGVPAPKGSARAFMTRGPSPRAVLAPASSKVGAAKLKSWDQAVRFAVNEATRGATAPLFVDTPVLVNIRFRMARPSGHWGRRGLRSSAPPFPSVKPDLDKLARATCDSLKGAIYDDDSRIVALQVSKQYADPGQEGAIILVEDMSRLDTQKGT